MRTGFNPEYNRPMLRRVLGLWPELEETLHDERLRVIVYDVELRVEQLAGYCRGVGLVFEHGTIVATMMLSGEGAVKSKAVSPKELDKSVERILRILEVEGLA